MTEGEIYEELSKATDLHYEIFKIYFKNCLLGETQTENEYWYFEKTIKEKKLINLKENLIFDLPTYESQKINSIENAMVNFRYNSSEDHEVL